MDFNALQDSLQRGPNLGCVAEAASIASRYTLLERVGCGAYGDVWSATRRSGGKEVYAVKRIDKRAAGIKGLRSVMGEVETMSLLSHPSIVRMEETFQDDVYLWIVMEYLPGDTLQHRLDNRGVSEAETRGFVTQLLMALEYCHGKGIVHRDLKPSNCLLSQNDLILKIADFGLSVLAGNEDCLTTRCGTPHYMAPELFSETNYGKPVDMWALGVMTHVMFFGRYPFQGRTEAALGREVCRGYHPAAAAEVSAAGSSVGSSVSGSRSLGGSPACPPLLQDFISQLLSSDPHRRLSATEALKHPWVKLGLDLNGRTSFSATWQSAAALPRLTTRWRAAVLAVIAAHRLLYLQKVKRLQRLGYDGYRLLRDYHYCVTGTYKPPSDSLDCSNMFSAHPMALLELVAMLDTCPRIRHVNLSWNGIQSLSVIQAFLKVVAQHASIESINLSHNPIPAVAGRALVRLARNPLSHVTSIDVGHTGITADTIGQINGFLKEKLTPAVLTGTSPLVELVNNRNTSRGSSDTAASSSSCNTPRAVRQKRSTDMCASKQSTDRGGRVVRLPPISRLPPMRHSNKTT